MVGLSYLFTLLLYAATFIPTLGQVTPGSLQQVTNFGSNPTNVGMYIYVPNNLASNPGIILAIHYCTGTAQAYYNGSPYAHLAEQYGFIVIYPDSPYSGNCWDVSSQATLTHNGGGNSNSLANMVTWTTEQYGADPSMVFVTGTSSGAMMTNVMAATYPELFTAGSVYSGVAAGCFVSQADQQDAWNASCAQGNVHDTPQQWANVVHDMYPGYSGAYPRMQIYHGSADAVLLPPNYDEACKQWAGVFGYDYDSPQQIIQNNPQVKYTTTIWGPRLEGIYAQGVGHTVPIHGDEDMEWFGFTASSTNPGCSTTSCSSTPPATSSPPPSSGGRTAKHWGQCGGRNWNGPTKCQSPYQCKKLNAWYSQCL